MTNIIKNMNKNENSRKQDHSMIGSPDENKHRRCKIKETQSKSLIKEPSFHKISTHKGGTGKTNNPECISSFLKKINVI